MPRNDVAVVIPKDQKSEAGDDSEEASPAERVTLVA
jgi:hypothetical protein